TVIATIGNECKSFSVRRPRGIFARATCIERRLRHFRTVDWRKPNAAILRECDSVTVGRNDWIVAVCDKLGRSSRRGYRPDLNSRLNRILRGIRRTVPLPAGPVVTAAHVNDRFAVARK